MSYRTTPVFSPETNPGIDQDIAAIKLTPHTLLTPATKKIIVDAASGGVWTSMTNRKLSRTGVNKSNQGDIANAICIVEMFSPVLIEIIGTDPPCGLNLIQEVGNIRKYTSPGLVRQSSKLDAGVDRKFSDDCNSTSIFSKVIGDKLSDGSRRDLYAHKSMNLAEDPVQTQTPQFVDMGLTTIDTLYEGSGISKPATIIRRSTDGAHWSTPNHIFDETIAVGVSEAKYDYGYNYKTEFQIWKENKKFERQNILMSQTPLVSTSVGTNTLNTKISTLILDSCWCKILDQKH